MERKEENKEDIYMTDTHSFIWYLRDVLTLSKKAKDIFERAENMEINLFIPITVLFELLERIERRRIPFTHIDEILIWIEERDNFQIVPLNEKVFEKRTELSEARRRGITDRDLQIVAIALKHGAILLTKDTKIIKSGIIKTIW